MVLDLKGYFFVSLKSFKEKTVYVYSTMRGQTNVSCLNCGVFGHTSKVCNYPVSSYGIICFKRIDGVIKYILVQKKDSIPFTEFLRGKYEINNYNYLLKLFSKMTQSEKNAIVAKRFNDLWKGLWNHSNDQNQKFQKEFSKSQVKFNKLRNGIYMKRIDGNVQLVNLNILVANTPCADEQIWEAPKGRRRLYESDLKCALREFQEEVGFHDRIVLHDSNKQFEETFNGSNGVRYRNVYYIAQYIGDASTVKFDENNHQQAKEVRNVGWFTYEEVLRHINSTENHEKRELFKRVNTIVHKHYF